MILEPTVNRFSSDPRQLFLINGLGALLSAFLLGFVLVKLERFFGIPQTTLYFLALLPCLFATYDLFCFKVITKNAGAFLKVIAFANLAYCFISIGMAIYHYQKLTVIGWSYISLEVMVLIFLISIEFKTAHKLDALKNH